nr:hypothetical protein [Candidatus Sigynarchaeum springense]
MKDISTKTNVEFIDSIPDQGAALNHAIKLAKTYRLCVHKVVPVTTPTGEIFAGLLLKSLPKGDGPGLYSGGGNIWGKRLGIYLIVSMIAGFVITIPISYGLHALYAACLGGGIPLGFLIGLIAWARIS